MPSYIATLVSSVRGDLDREAPLIPDGLRRVEVVQVRQRGRRCVRLGIRAPFRIDGWRRVPCAKQLRQVSRAALSKLGEQLARFRGWFTVF